MELIKKKRRPLSMAGKEGNSVQILICKGFTHFVNMDYPYELYVIERDFGECTKNYYDILNRLQSYWIASDHFGLKVSNPSHLIYSDSYLADVGFYQAYADSLLLHLGYTNTMNLNGLSEDGNGDIVATS